MDISEMTSSNVSEMHRFLICPFPISLFSDIPPFLPAPVIFCRRENLHKTKHISSEIFKFAITMSTSTLIGYIIDHGGVDALIGPVIKDTPESGEDLWLCGIIETICITRSWTGESRV
jgi:hypothetical protein